MSENVNQEYNENKIEEILSPGVERRPVGRRRAVVLHRLDDNMILIGSKSSFTGLKNETINNKYSPQQQATYSKKNYRKSCKISDLIQKNVNVTLTSQKSGNFVPEFSQFKNVKFDKKNTLKKSKLDRKIDKLQHKYLSIFSNLPKDNLGLTELTELDQEFIKLSLAFQKFYNSVYPSKSEIKAINRNYKTIIDIHLSLLFGQSEVHCWGKRLDDFHMFSCHLIERYNEEKNKKNVNLKISSPGMKPKFSSTIGDQRSKRSSSTIDVISITEAPPKLIRTTRLSVGDILDHYHIEKPSFFFDNWKKQILEIRDEVMDEILVNYSDCITWNPNHISYILRAVEKAIITPDFCNQLQISYREAHSKEDLKYASKVEEFATLMPLHLGIRQSLWLIGEAHPARIVSYYPPYHAAVQELRDIYTLPTPYEKLSCLKQTVKAIHFSVLDYYKRSGKQVDFDKLVIGADDLVALMAYVVIQSRLGYLYSEIMMLQDFISEQDLCKESGYYLVTLLASLQFIEDLVYCQVEENFTKAVDNLPPGFKF